MTNHLYESSEKLHICEGANVPDITGPYVVWTKCGIDVPANKSFKSFEIPTCLRCIRLNPEYCDIAKNRIENT